MKKILATIILILLMVTPSIYQYLTYGIEGLIDMWRSLLMLIICFLCIPALVIYLVSTIFE